MEVPEWLPAEDVKGEEELEYKLSLVNGIPQMHRFEVRATPGRYDSKQI